MQILVVNWQDRENPQAGGAEIHLHEIFGRLAAQGHEVSLLCGGWPGCAPRAVLDGIAVTRVGTRNTFRMLARGAYKEHFAHRPFDVLVEDINKMPLHTPHWGAVPVVAVVPHLFGSTVFDELPRPLAAAVWLAERPIPWVYRGVPFEAISESTADDLAGRGISREQIRVIYCGIDSTTYTPSPGDRSATPVFAYLGRLKRYKAVDLVLRGFARAAIPGARLEVAGAGDYRPALERLANSLDLGDRVTFLGRISEADKLRLLRRAWALVFTSPKEGWGITNLEAAACGTAVIASDSPGIRESVRHGETGFLVRHGDIEGLAASMTRLAGDRALAERLGVQGRAFATSFTWERAASETAQHLDEVLHQRRLEEPRIEGGG
ncbi:MAG TPA: glycosyltransferase family 4 protein [Gemmatimonadaceae bacterium]|nr:glycosyltransferase family 4 protein [Gemmatimonadaceae bacterium]